jgi:xanthine dehydrogenase YagS FAD-binding subunit
MQLRKCSILFNFYFKKAMVPFTFVKAKDKREAINASAIHTGSKFLGGGTNLVDLMKMNIETPAALIDINGLDLKKIQVLPNGNVRIGALVKNSDLAYDSIISGHYPLLSQALLSGASPQLRNMATTAGNVLQRTRCSYFYDTVTHCNKRQPGSGCSAINGYNRMHAVLGISDQCIATHPSDMCVAMAALDAIVHISGPAGDRAISFLDFHLLPGNTPEKENVLQYGDLITAVEIPDLPFAKNSIYVKTRDRSSYEFALASAAVALDINGGIINDSRIALGGVGTKPWRCKSAEEFLKGKALSDDTFRGAAEVALQGAITHKYNSFKPELAKRTLLSALQTTGGIA